MCKTTKQNGYCCIGQKLAVILSMTSSMTLNGLILYLLYTEETPDYQLFIHGRNVREPAYTLSTLLIVFGISAAVGVSDLITLFSLYHGIRKFLDGKINKPWLIVQAIGLTLSVIPLAIRIVLLWSNGNFGTAFMSFSFQVAGIGISHYFLVVIPSVYKCNCVNDESNGFGYILND